MTIKIKENAMPWHTVRCTYQDWGRSYKRHSQAHHNHNSQQQFIIDAKNNAQQRLQARFGNVPLNQIGTTLLQVNLQNDPGDNFTVI